MKGLIPKLKQCSLYASSPDLNNNDNNCSSSSSSK